MHLRLQGGQGLHGLQKGREGKAAGGEDGKVDNGEGGHEGGAKAKAKACGVSGDRAKIGSPG